MGYRQELERRIREAYSFIREHQRIMQVSTRPEEKSYSEIAIEQHWAQIERYFREYVHLCRRQQIDIPDDLKEMMAARFPYLLDSDSIPADNLSIFESAVTSSTLILAGRTLETYLEVLYEWKELHNLLQEVLTSLTPLTNTLELACKGELVWSASLGLQLWRQVRIQLRRLEAFSRDIRYIDEPFDDGGGTLKGAVWMVVIAPLQNELDDSIRMGDCLAGYNLAVELSDVCSTYLYNADKHLRDVVGEIRVLSSNLLRGMKGNGG